jgi:hypothetical protein
MVEKCNYPVMKYSQLSKDAIKPNKLINDFYHTSFLQILFGKVNTNEMHAATCSLSSVNIKGTVCSD